MGVCQEFEQGGGPSLPRLRTQFPHAVREIPNEWIPLSDGIRLAARIWLPEESAKDPGAHRVPAILEYLPYRKSDAYAWQDSTRHPYFAGHGYASVRVDIRGSGDSEGLLLGEYLQQELDDALEVIEWLGSQPWCSGEVGMIGYSWGGFNSLQVASLRPPRLRAIVTGCASDDRYRDDCHYMGGCLLASDMLKWASTMLAISAMPPDPLVVGERWRDLWLERLNGTPAFAEEWIAHQRYDEFWKHGSVAEDYGAIECAVLAFGGWTDAYTNGIPRLLEHLTCPRRGIIGPWGHMFPERGVPGPAIGFLQECVRWWDRWLKGIDNGVDAEPLLHAWMQEYVPPANFYAERPGRWIAEDSWPPADVSNASLVLASGPGLGSEPRLGEPSTITIVGSQACGETAGVWCANGLPAELPVDQRPDDERSLSIDTALLDGRLELLGSPVAHLRVSSSRPLALVAVRLCDVAPTGESTLLTWGQLNLTHRHGSEEPRPLVPDTWYDVRIEMNALGCVIPEGHRLRISISPTYWPHAWPSPEPVRLAVAVDRPSTLEIPVRVEPPDKYARYSAAIAARDTDATGEASGGSEADTTSDAAAGAATAADRGAIAPVEFGPPEESAPLLGDFCGQSARTRNIDTFGNRHAIWDREDHTTHIEESGCTLRVTSEDSYSIDEEDPLSAMVCCTREYTLEREGWSWLVRTESEMICDAKSFKLTNRVEARENDAVLSDRTHRAVIPRDML